MPTWGPFAVEADVTTRRDSTLAAGLGDHLPVGYWSGAIYRSALRFPKPPWADWTSIVKATLTFYISDHQHVGVRNSSIYVRRNSGTVWTKAAGTQDCESGFSAGNNTQASDLGVDTTNQVVFASGTTANAKKTVSVTLMTRAMWADDVAKLVYVLDPQASDDYTEIWSREKGSTYDATLEIEYTEATVPSTPTQVAPTAGATVDDTTPRFEWTHNSPTAQTGARVRLYGSDGTTFIAEHTVVGAANFLDWPDVLVRGDTYNWQVYTSNTYGESPGSAGWAFTVKGAPTVTIDAVRRMVFSNGAPRLVVQWSSDQVQSAYQVTAPGYSSGLLSGTATQHTLDGLNLVSGTPVTVTVAVTSATGTGSASRAFTPRFGLTTHRKDLTTVPAGWVGATIEQDAVAPATIQMEYGSTASAVATTPDGGWFSTLGAVTRRRYLMWRAWFIPSATLGPTLKKVVITTSAALSPVDKWGTTRDTPGLDVADVWAIDPSESVYGTRSMKATLTDTAEHRVYAYKVHLHKDRTYILTGLMKSEGNSGATFRLEKPPVAPSLIGEVLQGGGIIEDEGPVQAEPLIVGTDWYNKERNDTNRYKTPGYLSDSEQDVYVVLVVDGEVGAQAWFDAIKLEESTVATPWSPGAIGATVIDAGGVQIDATRGGVFRFKGSGFSDANPRAVVSTGAKGFAYGGDTELSSPSTGVMAVNDVPISLNTHGHAMPSIPYPVPGAIAHGSAALALLNGTLKLDVRDGGSAAIADVANNRFVVPAGMGGLWRVTAAIVAANTATGERHIAGISKNGAGVASSYAYPNVGGTAAFNLAIDLMLAAGDLITFTGTSTVSADWTVSAASMTMAAQNIL